MRNDTPEGNTIQSIALTDDAKTYKIGDTIGIELTFAEAVNVSGAPTLALEIGSASRKAALVRGSGSAVLTFEYSVVEGDEDANGIAIEANGLAVPAGASIVDTVGGEAAILRHPVRGPGPQGGRRAPDPHYRSPDQCGAGGEHRVERTA